jgi:hypothetical protein
MGQGSAYGGVEEAKFRAGWGGRKKRLAALGRAAAVVAGVLWLAVLPACGRRDVDEPSSRESVSHTAQAVSASTQVIVRRIGENYELEVRGDRALTPRGDSDPALVIGEETFAVYRNSPDTAKGAIYPLTAEQFAALPDGAEVRVVYGVGVPGRVYGTLNKAAVEVEP